ncbi:MAG: hypothetical protein J6333_13125, partial [Planctomycetes bacterium]|nr:hypothetical protein [Planctomycetota bacterium]
MDKRWMKRCLAACATAMLACGGAGAQDWNSGVNYLTTNINVDVANINNCTLYTGNTDPHAGGELTAGTLNVNNGSLYVDSPANLADFGAINITLGNNNTADGGSFVFRCAIFFQGPGDDGGTAAMLAGKLKLSGGEVGKSYGVLENFTFVEDAAVIAAIKNAGSVYSYDVSFVEDCAYIATVVGVKSNSLADAAMKDSTAYVGIAVVLTDLAMRYEQLSPELQQVMDALNNQGANLGRAITELNGANAAVAGVKVSTNAAQQFNAALGNVFADRQMARRAAGRESASAGGLPVTYANVGNAADCERRYSGWLKAYGG